MPLELLIALSGCVKYAMLDCSEYKSFTQKQTLGHPWLEIHIQNFDTLRSMFSSLNAPIDLSQRIRRIFKQRVGACFGLWGEPGIGKTHTANAFIRELSISSFAIKAKTSSQFFLIRLPIAKRKVPKWASIALETTKSGGHVESRALIAAFSAYLSALSPFVLHLEDLHEASLEQLAFWTELAQAVKRTSNVVMLASSRTLPTAPFEPIQLGHLSFDQSGVLLETEIGGELPQRAKAWIFNHAQGNPLFTLEFLRHMVRQGFLWSDGARWRWREPIKSVVPSSVEAVIGLVLEEAYRLTNGQAVLGALALTDLSEPKVWSHLVCIETNSLKKARIGLERLGVLKGSEFTHPLYRELVLRDLPSPLARALARAALDQPLSDPSKLEAYLDKAQLEPQAAFHRLEQAWLEAERRGNPLDAAHLQARAALLRDGEERVRLALGAFNVLKNNHGSEAAKLLEALQVWESDNPDVIERLAKLYAQQGRRDEGQLLLEQLSERKRDPSRWRKRLLEFKLLSYQHPEALKMFEVEPGLLNTVSPGSLAGLAFALGYEGRLDQANALLIMAEAQAVKATELFRILNVKATLSMLSGNPDSAMEQYTNAVTLAEQIQSPRHLAGALYNRSVLATRMDRFSEAAQDLERCLDLKEAEGNAWAYAEYLAPYGETLMERGEFIRAEDALLQALAILENGQPSADLVVAECILVDLYCTWEAPHASALTIKYARDAWRHAQFVGMEVLKLQSLIALAKAEAMFGQPALALDHVGQAFEIIERCHLETFHPNALWIEGVVLISIGQLEQASAFLKQASALMQDRRAKLTAELVLLELDRINHDVISAQQKLELFTKADYGRGIYMVKRYFPTLETDLPRTASQLTIGLLGELHIERDKHIIRLQGLKRKVLIALLAEASVLGRDGKTQVDLLDALYPNQPELEAVAALHQLVRQTRVLLGEASIVTLESGYGLRKVNLDIVEFLETGDTKLWHGAYLEDVALEANPQVLEALKTKLHDRTKSQLETDPHEAARVARILLEMDTYDLVALEMAVRALQNLKHYTSLKRLYLQTRVALHEVGEVLPELWKDFLLERMGDQNVPILSD